LEIVGALEKNLSEQLPKIKVNTRDDGLSFKKMHPIKTTSPHPHCPHPSHPSVVSFFILPEMTKQKNKSTQIALQTIIEYLKEHQDIQLVRIVLYDQSTYTTFCEELKKLI
jgi:hypothetical protein